MASTGMKANNVQAHQLQLSAEFMQDIKSVKSNATDAEASELIREMLTSRDTSYNG